MDQFRNFAISSVLTAPSPATSGASLTLASGDGAAFPQPSTDGPFSVVVWPVGAQPSAANAEIIRVTARATDVLTIVRAQEGSTARSVLVGDQVMQATTRRTMADAGARGSDVIVGEQTLPRFGCHVDYFAPTSGRCYFTCFQASGGGLTVNNVRAISGSANSSGLTLARFGLYIIDDSTGLLTLVASSANNTTAVTASSVISRALSASYTFIPGRRYAGAALQVFTTTGANICGSTDRGGWWNARPRLSCFVAAADLPATQADAGLTDMEYGPYIAFIP